jgi:hypothetical protein
MVPGGGNALLCQRGVSFALAPVRDAPGIPQIMLGA